MKKMVSRTLHKVKRVSPLRKRKVILKVKSMIYGYYVTVRVNFIGGQSSIIGFPCKHSPMTKAMNVKIKRRLVKRMVV